MDSISRMDFFAANAPAEIPEWFKIDPTPISPEPQPDLRIESEARSWVCDPHYDFAVCFRETVKDSAFYEGYRELAEKYEKAMNAWWKERAEARQKDVEQRYFGWRWYYALLMIETAMSH